MTQRTLSSIIFLMIFPLATTTALAGGHTAKAKTETSSKETKATSAPDQPMSDKKIPVTSEPKPEAPHGKVHAPHMEEEAHIHKFHKERVKKIKKHHSKYWFLSQVILALCHLSILVIAYLHATH